MRLLIGPAMAGYGVGSVRVRVILIRFGGVKIVMGWAILLFGRFILIMQLLMIGCALG